MSLRDDPAAAFAEDDGGSIQGGSVALIDPRRLRPIEGHGPRRAEWVQDLIVEAGTWTRPICVERHHLLVLDGHHRLQAALTMNLALVPCQLFNYGEVEVWSLRPQYEVSTERIVEVPCAVISTHTRLPSTAFRHQSPRAPSN